MADPRRWRLVLGREADEPLDAPLGVADRKVDGALEALYDSDRRGGLGGRRPSVARWLGDIREYFPTPVVQVLQRDAIDRLGLRELLLEPELLEAVEPDVQLVADLLALAELVPARTRDTARRVVRRVVDDLERRLALSVVASVTGSLDRSARTRRPRLADVDWDRTIRANLRHYRPELGTVVPERLVGHTRRRRGQLHDVVIAVDQSGSMATSLVHASVLAAVLASVRAVRTSLVAFDTEVVDLTGLLADPVDVLFGATLGGGTDIERAVAYCEGLVRRPAETTLLLVTDLFEGGDPDRLLARLHRLRQIGTTVVCLLALSDQGAPAHDPEMAAAVAGLGIATFACTPDRFAGLLAAALERRDLTAWAEASGLSTVRPPG